jgi:hypothetical protein
VNVRLDCQPLLLQPVPPETQLKEYWTLPDASVAVTAVMLIAEVLVAFGGDCQVIWDGEGGVVSVGVPSASVVALAVGERLFRFPAASLAITL